MRALIWALLESCFGATPPTDTGTTDTGGKDDTGLVDTGDTGDTGDTADTGDTGKKKTVAGPFSITEPDHVGIVWDDGTTTIDAKTGSIVTGTLYLFNPSVDKVAGFELEVVVPKELLLASVTYPRDTLNIATPPEFIAGFHRTAHMGKEAWLPFAEMSFIVMSEDVADIHLDLSTPSSVKGEVVYVNGNDFGDLIPMTPTYGDFVTPVARVNGPAL